MTLKDKIEKAKSCVYFNAKKSSNGSCKLDGYSPFDCEKCTSYRKKLSSMFIDGKCPKCNRLCGNGGSGPLRCACGWVDTEDTTAEIDRLFAEEFGEEQDNGL